jgi:hypothetical protein
MKKETKKLSRIHRVTLVFNDEECKAINRYIRKYKVVNKSRWYRETILSHVIKTLVDDYPTLFNEEEMK